MSFTEFTRIEVDYNTSETGKKRVPESRKTFLQELVECLHRPKLSKWCFCVSVALAIVVITALVIYTDYNSDSPTPIPPTPQPQKAPFLKEYFLHHTLAPNLFNGTFISGTKFYYYDHTQNLVVFDLTKMRSDIILPYYSGILLNGTFNFWFSADLQYMMFASELTQIYRHSYFASYQVYNFNSEKITHVARNSVQLAVFAPETNAIAYVDRNNIFYRANPEDEKADVQLTFDGVNGQLYNGVPDWVYEEEILSSNTALWFSKNASHLAYLKFNDSEVVAQAIPLYGPPNNMQWQYTRYDQIHYPKVGTPNPTVSVHVVSVGNLKEGESLQEYTYPPPLDLLDNMEPIPSVLAWVSDTKFIVVWMNRYQNILVIQLCNVDGKATCQTVFHHHENEGWLQLESPKFDGPGNRMIFIWWQPQINGDWYPHVTLLNLADSSAKPLPITSGVFSVTEIVGWNHETDEVFFLATIPGAPEQLVTYKVLAHAPYTITCLSCGQQRSDGCLYAGAVVSPNGHFYALSCAGPGVPEVTLCDQTGKELMVWEDNKKIRAIVERLSMPVKKIVRVPLGNNFTATVQLLLPASVAADFDSISGQKYPLLVNVYAGPDSSLVKEMFSSDFNTFIVANKSVIGVSIDGRGSNLLGQRARYSIYKKLGQVEVPDQLAVIKYLQETYPFIDGNRTASWGWSYGGFTTGMMLTEDKENRIKCGISIAPVTDWTYYDSIYTERFMLSLAENLQGYMSASLLNKAPRLKNKEFFLIHGTKDDNVHYQNSMQLSKILARHDIPFRQMTYADEDHGLRYVQPHFYHAIEDFLDECFFGKSS